MLISRNSRNSTAAHKFVDFRELGTNIINWPSVFIFNLRFSWGLSNCIWSQRFIKAVALIKLFWVDATTMAGLVYLMAKYRVFQKPPPPPLTFEQFEIENEILGIFLSQKGPSSGGGCQHCGPSLSQGGGWRAPPCFTNDSPYLVIPY